MTNTELVVLLGSTGRDVQQVRDILERCADVEFAKGSLAGEEFPAMAAYIRELIDNAP